MSSKMLEPASGVGGIEGQHVDLQAIASQQMSITEVANGLSLGAKHIALKRMQLDELVSMNDLSLTATYMLDKINQMTDDEAFAILREAVETFNDDANFPNEEFNLIVKLVQHVEPGFNISSTSPIETSVINFFKSKFGKGNSAEIISSPIDEFKKPSSASESVDSRDIIDEKEKVFGETKQVYSDDQSDFESHEHDYYNKIFDWSLQARIEASLISWWSPYPEVRSATVPYDDPTQICETWRAYVVGLIWVAISAFINQYFAQRMPGIYLPSSACQLLIYPTGLIVSLLPKFTIPLFKGYKFELNPGPWGIKEQMLATMMVAITGTPYIEGPIYAQRMSMFYNQKWVKWGYQVLLGISTQFVGFGLAGMVRKFCIYPSKAVWPTILPTVVLNRSLLVREKKENINGWTISRYAYFFIVFACSFVYYWIPGYLFTALSTFNWMTWIKPDNLNLANITGSVSGLGLNPVPTFDWNNISYIFDPLAVPAFNFVNTAIGVFVGFFAIVGVYYSNYYWSAYLPINSSATFSNTGEPYDISQILNEQSSFDQAKYEKYGPPFYTAANLILYGAFFASYPFTFLYVCFTNWKDILFASKSLWASLKQFHRSSLEGFNDPHSKMMRQYKEVPEWVFLAILIVAIVLGIVVVEIYPTDTPVWGIFFTIAMNFVFLVPITILYSITGYQLTMNVLVELIVGYALPGKPNAHLILKSYGTQTDMQAQDYMSNQKIGHYAKIPPWSAFRVQVLATFVSLFISLGVINWQIDSFEGLCTPHQPQKFTCAGDAQVYFSASVIWGVLGPKRIFSGLYPVLKYCFLIGFLLTFPCYIIYRVLPKRWRKWWQPAIIIAGPLNFFAPYNLTYFTGAFYLSLTFMIYIKNKYLAWWCKYNYVTTSGMTAGLAISAVVLFFAVGYHEKDLNWWGNMVSYEGIDGDGAYTLKNVTFAPDGYFGPRIGNFP